MPISVSFTLRLVSLRRTLFVELQKPHSKRESTQTSLASHSGNQLGQKSL